MTIVQASRLVPHGYPPRAAQRELGAWLPASEEFVPLPVDLINGIELLFQLLLVLAWFRQQLPALRVLRLHARLVDPMGSGATKGSNSRRDKERPRGRYSARATH
jgi:hypothetical protein